MGFSVKEHLEKIPVFFDPDKYTGRKLVLIYKINRSGENDGVWTVRIQNGTCVLEEGESSDFTGRMLMTAEVYERIVTGKMDHDLAYWIGAVLYAGSMLNFQELQTFLTIPENSGIIAL
ncbi:hypothetical protein [Ruminococcus gauvreauii]|uniref:Uncharacterized protein n=1 Tax=Ruminococcus gauvreauii TaxID=438033 RepID=A0ABY5VCT8_9FIRM|nr:hypothetical protein [Ruminococcus gauvreauii]UWP58306.1 hypothetical protein NQ502_13060 [Ruminococcus gauvreauii]